MAHSHVFEIQTIAAATSSKPAAPGHSVAVARAVPVYVIERPESVAIVISTDTGECDVKMTFYEL